MLREDCYKLMEHFQESMEGKPVDMKEVCQESLEFFQSVKKALQQGSQEEKQEALNMMTEMYRKLLTESKHFKERTGMNEEQIVALSEDASQYTPEQWKMIQETKKNMTYIGGELSQLLTAGKIIPPPVPKPPSEKKRRSPKSKRSNWLRS